MDLQDYVNLLGNGFLPIILVAYFLWKEKIHKDDLKEIIAEYKDTIHEMSTKHENTLISISQTLTSMNERINDLKTEIDKHE